ncbi:pyroglutamyl-peptidase I [bacterium]|nr:pyroglutamyl-peptidase I [candidate division CSSED10-310 bacterium]
MTGNTCSSAEGQIILTGFEPYLDNPVNSSQIMANQFRDGAVHGHPVRTVVLEASYRQCREFAGNLAGAGGIAAVVMLGLRPSAELIELERIAVNIEDSPCPDAGGVVADNRIIQPGGPDGIFSSLPLQTFRTVLNRAGIPCRISNSAGTYVCNSLFYRVLERMMEIPCGFIHLPPLSDSWSRERLTEAVDAILGCLFPVNIDSRTG